MRMARGTRTYYQLEPGQVIPRSLPRTLELSVRHNYDTTKTTITIVSDPDVAGQPYTNPVTHDDNESFVKLRILIYIYSRYELFFNLY